MKSNYAAILLCALILGGILLARSTLSASSAPTFSAGTATFSPIASSANQQNTDTEQQSMLAPLIFTIIGLTVTLTHFIVRRRAKDNDT